MSQAPIVLSTGSIARLPITMKREFKTRAVEFMDGTRQRFQDLGIERRSYSLNLNAMKETEKADWLDLYRTAQGGFNTFTFVSPIENLLKWNEQLENPIWQKGANVVIGKNYATRSKEFDHADWVTGGIGGGGVTVTPNQDAGADGTSSEADQLDFLATGTGDIIRQDVEGSMPAAYQGLDVVGSIFLRAASSQTIKVVINDGPTQTENEVTVTTTMQRFEHTHSLDAAATRVRFELLNDNGQPAKTIFAWGVQLEFGILASDFTETVATAVELKIAGPFWQPAPTQEIGAADGFNSLLEKRGRQIVSLAASGNSIQQNPLIVPGGHGRHRSLGMQFSGSLWVKRQGATGVLTVNINIRSAKGALGNGSVVELFTTSGLTPSADWVRGSLTARFSASNQNTTSQFWINPSTVGTFYVFGAQFQTGAAITEYMGETTTKSGVMTAAFQNDSMSENHVVFGLSNVSDLEIVEEL